MSTKKTVGIVVAVIGVILIAIGGFSLNDIVVAEQQAQALGGLFGGAGNDLLGGLGLDAALEAQKNKAYGFVVFGIAAIVGGVYMLKTATEENTKAA
ncbi:hypothetical protein AHAT_14840 [Agarivorans sp. Toyoura001]|uniref:hypothetical protein n=1 Tax=Agarivorans sp. Toyoura001 TaxID=2283141 RepID=UPI0010D418AB|nr:hypothetical protein [Agarivorans sp. Toyoura001]GDY25594.1 hypothetical protein AHAT_14840 [Agarivorans sp. Toyoura001]